jgi:glucosamine--fructose-6-phosphate aminotransferase (isomerizing)
MCGIIGYVGQREVSPILLEGLKRLEYRGYDSAGVAVLNKAGGLDVIRAQGKISKLEERLQNGGTPKGVTGLGHSRWATHGRPSEENAHPHVDCSGRLVVVHNGIIENYLPLKEELLAKGHKFASETDTEVLTHLIEDTLKTLTKNRAGLSPDLLEPLFFEAVRQALGRVRGAYGVCVLWADCPKAMIGARQHSPLVVGLGDKEAFFASDVPAFMSHTRKALFLDDGELAMITPEGAKVFNLAGQKVQKNPVQIQWDRSMAEKGGYRHFMLKEIHEQPRAIEDTMRGRLFPVRSALEQDIGLPVEVLKGCSQVQFLACGTAHHAGMVGSYLAEELAGVPAKADIASEFRYRQFLLDPKTLVVAISQSGETADTLAAVRLAKSKGLKVLAVCNSVGSSLTREADWTLYTHCGPEIGVASTKAFTTQLTALQLVALQLALARGTLDDKTAGKRVDELAHVPQLVREALALDAEVQAIARSYHKRNHFLFLGRHVNFPIALEGALKLKEISYIHAEGYAAGEMKHGPIALIDEEMPIVAIATKSRVHDKTLSNLQEAKARGGTLIALATKGDREVKAQAHHVLELPETPELLSPIVNVIPLQLLAYHVASLRGCDVDQPRNLAKSVTVE